MVLVIEVSLFLVIIRFFISMVCLLGVWVNVIYDLSDSVGVMVIFLVCMFRFECVNLIL